MTLPDFLLPGNPFRPWAFALGACLLACLPPPTRRIGGILTVIIITVGAIALFVDDALRTCTPGG